MSGLWSDFFWGDALFGDVDPEADDYVTVLVQLLPKGVAWDQWDVEDRDPLLRGLAHEAARVELRVWQLLEEIDPRTTLELLPDWERVYGLPEKCGVPPSTIDGRRRALHAKMAAKPQGNIPFFLQLAANLGYPDAEIRSLHDPFTCESDCIDSLFGWEGGWADAWMLLPNATSETDDTLQCIAPKYAQAHEHVLFRADVESVFEGVVLDFNMETLVDAATEATGADDGTTYDADTRSRAFAGNSEQDRINITPGTELAGSAISIELWIRPASLAAFGRVIDARVSSGTDSHYVAVDTLGRIRFFRRTSGTSMRADSANGSVAVGVWHHVVVTHDASLTAANVRIYVDGVESPSYPVQTDGTGTESSTAFGFTLGGRPLDAFATEYFNGDIADRPKIWPRELTAQEVADLYASYFAPPTQLEATEAWP